MLRIVRFNVQDKTLFPSANGLRPDARRFARAAVAFPVTVAVTDSAPQQCEAGDIGGGGIRLAMPGDLSPGTIVLLRFRLPEGDREIVARGKTVMSFYNGQRACYMHGIAFTHIDPKDRETIISFVEAAVTR